MGILKRLLPGLAALGFSAVSFAQAPPPVPGLPDTQRLTSYTINAATGPYSVGFALYGDSTDYGDWLEVRLCTSAVLTPCSALTATTQWTLSSATGPLATIPRPITDATITLTSAMTGTLQIVGARRPRRTSQFAENRGVAARDLNQAVTDLTAQNRETWDRLSRTIRAEPGEVISPLQPAATRAGGILCWDSTGLIPNTCAPGSSGTANVVGPNVSVVGHIATFGNTSGTLITDGGLVGSGNVVGPNPSSSVANHAVTWKDTTGINIIDSGLTLSPSTGTFTLTNAKTLAVTNSLTLSGTDGTTMTFPTTSATLARTDAANTFTGHQTIEGVTSTGATGTGNFVFSASPTISGTWAGSPTFSGTIGFSGQLNAVGTTSPTSTGGNTSLLGTLASVPTLTNTGQALHYNTTAGGAIIQGDGSTDDFRLYNKGGSIVMNVPTGATAPVFPGLSGGSCVSGLGLDVSNNTILVSCPGAAASIQVGSTTVTGGTNGYLLYNNSGTLGNATLVSLITAGTGISVTGSPNPTITSNFAVKSDQLTPSSTVLHVNPAVQQFHPSASKAWVHFGNCSTSTCTLGDSYNVSGVSRSATGTYVLSFTVSFADASYSCGGGVGGTSAGVIDLNSPTSVAVGSIPFKTFTLSAPALFDPTDVYIQCFGPQ